MSEALLTARTVSFAYGRLEVLRELDLEMRSGEIVAVLGANGSGKSTLIKLLLGHLRGRGQIAWDGRHLHDWSRRDLARCVAYLPQSPAWEGGQVVEDVLRLGRAPFWGAFGIESPRDVETVNRVAELLDLDGLFGRRMDEISGGQRQRIFLGRCLVQEPRAMLLDEPATFLDLRHQLEFLQLLRRLAVEQSIAVLMASHDLNLSSALADRVALLEGGRILAVGRPDQVLQPELLATAYGLPMQRIERGGRPPLVFPRDL